MKHPVANGEIRFISSIYDFERAPCPASVLANPILSLFTNRVLGALVVTKRCVELFPVFCETDSVEEGVAVGLLVPLFMTWNSALLISGSFSAFTSITPGFQIGKGRNPRPGTAGLTGCSTA